MAKRIQVGKRAVASFDKEPSKELLDLVKKMVDKADKIEFKHKPQKNNMKKALLALLLLISISSFSQKGWAKKAAQFKPNDGYFLFASGTGGLVEFKIKHLEAAMPKNWEVTPLSKDAKDAGSFAAKIDGQWVVISYSKPPVAGISNLAYRFTLKQ